VHQIEISPDRLVGSLLRQADGRSLCLLDSCGVGRPGANRLIAGINPVDVIEIREADPDKALRFFDEELGRDDTAAIFTLSYDLGARMNGLSQPQSAAREPDIFIALFEGVIVHDYGTGDTLVDGNRDAYEDIVESLKGRPDTYSPRPCDPRGKVVARSNFSRSAYLAAIEEIQELIRSGETYQTNLTQQLSVPLAKGRSAASVFLNLREMHPAPFAAYIDRGSSIVVSASPEQFIKVEAENGRRKITSSPIKGTRPRGTDETSDATLRAELLSSEKDRAENKMIVDLMRNDLGRICEYGSVSVTELCRLEAHPTLFHLVSTIEGDLRPGVTYADMLRAVFPCGSITGAPKIRTMEIIERIEPDPRGLPMGAFGYRLPAGMTGEDEQFEMSVAIRTMVIKDGSAVFNVGGGVVIDSDPGQEYDESLLKARALLHALGVTG
jgi:para-aminobenzoate synthetase component I